jgi:hypothetical protein
MHDELNINNHNQHCVGVAALPKIHHNDKNLHRAIFFKETNPRKMVCLLGADAIGVRIVNVTEPPQNERFVNQDQL